MVAVTADTASRRIVAALERHGSRITRSGGQVQAQCPAHEDRTPSLSVRQIDGQALVCCRAGCHTDDVLAALNLTMKDLYDEPRGTASYRYRDARGQVVRTVVRNAPGSVNRFSQRGDTKGHPPLYRLPRVIEAVREGTTVYIVEGEKDVHALEAVGAVATTSPMGAGSWGKVDPSPLRGAHVVVVPDQDDAGRRYLADVLASLDGLAASVNVAAPRVGKDAADHVAAGHGLDTLVPDEAPETVPVGAPVVTTLADVTAERIVWLWPGRLPGGKLVIVDGDPAVGKSTVAVDWAARVSTGSPWPDGAPCARGDVVILSAEDGLADTIRPRLDAAGGDPARVHALTGVRVVDEDGTPGERPVTLADVATIRAAVERHHALLLIVDVLMAYLPGGTDSHRDQDVRAVLSRVARVAEDTGCTVVLLRHLTKGSAGSSPLYRGGGSIGIIGAARAGYVVAVDPDDDTGARRVIAATKCNLAAAPDSLAYTLVPDEATGTARVAWHGVHAADAATLLRPAFGDDERTERDAAAEWLTDYLTEHAGRADWTAIRAAGRRDGHAERTLQRARTRASVATQRDGFPARTVWTLEPVAPVAPQSRQSRQASRAGATGATGPDAGATGADGLQHTLGPDPVRNTQSDQNRGVDQVCSLCGQLSDIPSESTVCRRCDPFQPRSSRAEGAA